MFVLFLNPSKFARCCMSMENLRLLEVQFEAIQIYNL